MSVRQLALARCSAEQSQIIADAAQTDFPAWLVVLGLEDWEMEKRFIEGNHVDRNTAWGTIAAGEASTKC